MSLIAIVVGAAVAGATRRPLPGVAAGVLVWLLTSVYLTVGAGDGGAAHSPGSPLNDLGFVLIQLAILGATIAAGFLVGRFRQPSRQEA